jgi:hypothetical protein
VQADPDEALSLLQHLADVLDGYIGDPAALVVRHAVYDHRAARFVEELVVHAVAVTDERGGESN